MPHSATAAVALATRPRTPDDPSDYDLHVSADVYVGLDDAMRNPQHVTVGPVTVSARSVVASNKIVLNGGLDDLRRLRDVLDHAIAAGHVLEMAHP